MNDRIEKTIELKAPIARVWRALSDHQDFGAWFRVDSDGPFVVGQVSRGKVTYPGCENGLWHATIVAMEPERLFSFTWRPYAVDPAVDYETETPTLVEFRLEAIDGGTRPRLTESGFDKIPPSRRQEAYFRNDGGWTRQMKDIEHHVG